MKTSMIALIAAIAVLGAVVSTTAAPLQMSYHWHMQQPIYWPAQSKINPNTYQFAAESINLKSTQGGHPENQLDSIFGKADRIADYQHYPQDAIQSCSNAADMGASISFSGCLIENLDSLAGENRDGFAPGWNDTYAKSRTWTTSGGKPKVDLVAFTYHHALTNMIDKNALAMELAIHKVVYNKTWAAGGPNYSKGFFGAEMTFHTAAIPTLMEAGVEWAIVANNHLSRACKDYPFSPAGDNNDPPNAAYQQNPAQTNYFKQSISRGCTPNNAYPFAYTPHYVQHVDPTTSKVSKIVAVPAAMAMSWDDGYACYDTQGMQQIAAGNDPDHPMLVLMAHDGDNSFGGGYTYYTSCVKNLVNDALSQGYNPTTVDQYLKDFPVDETDIVAIESGAWVNKAGDFGSAQSYGWDWPLLPKTPTGAGDFDIPNGWAVNERSWAIITAGQNMVETAEQFTSPVNPADVQAPTDSSTNAEKAWNAYLPSLTSGYMYYGSVLDMPVKSTVACNLAYGYAMEAITAGKAAGKTDTTPPSIWAPQRLPWNPGSYGAGALWGYKYTQMNTSFYVWTFVSDYSGMQSVDLMYRVDADGEDPLNDYANDVYEPEAFGYTGVSSWTSVPMTRRVFPAGNVYNESGVDLDCNASNTPCLPKAIADEYYVQLTQFKNQLVDYYIQATDVHGNVKKTDIQHVFVGSGPSA